jgi:protein-tyrosine phosphatase
MIDLHSHILHGLDDGARTLADSVEIAARLAGPGSRDRGTPHVRDDWPTDAGVMEYRVAELRSELQPPESRSTCGRREIALDWLRELPSEELRRFGLGGHALPAGRDALLRLAARAARRLVSLRDEGIAPVLAHPERNARCRRTRAPRAAGRGRRPRAGHRRVGRRPIGNAARRVRPSG